MIPESHAKRGYKDWELRPSETQASTDPTCVLRSQMLVISSELSSEIKS